MTRKKRLGFASLLLAMLLFVLIQTETFQQWLLRRLQNFASAANFPFKADKLRLNIFELRAALDGFVYDKDGTKIRVDHVMIDIPWNGFFNKNIVVNSFFADGVTITVMSPETVVPSPSGEQQSIPKFQIGQLGIHNVSLEYTNQNMLVRIPAFNIDAENGRGFVRIAAPISISPDTQIALQQIPIVLNGDFAQFGPLNWSMQYQNYDGSGAADGDIKWSPSVAFHLNFSSNPMTIEKWKELQASGTAGYDEGKLKLHDVRIVQGTGVNAGQLLVNAEISDQNKTATIVWNGLRIDPTGVPGKTDGTLNLQWKATDFSDVSGQGVVDVATREYGKAHTSARITNGKANLDVQANAMDAAIRANIIAGLDHSLSGSFSAVQRKFGLINVNGKVAGTFENPIGDGTVVVRNATYEGVGPLNGSAKATIRGRLLTVSELQAQLKNSTIPDGSMRINLDNKKITGAIPQINIESNDFVPDARGKASLSASFAGTTDSPTAELTGASDGIDVGGTHIDSAKMNARFANNTLVVNQLEARQAEGSLEAVGSLNLTTKRIDADAHITNLQIVQVRDLTTTVNLDAKIDGTTESPSTTFKGEFQNIVYQGQDRGNVSVEGAIANQVATIHASSDKYNASTDAEVRMEQPYRFDATLTANSSHIQYEQYDVVANGKASATGQAQPFEARELRFDKFSVKGNGVDLTANGAMDSGVEIKGTADLSQLPVENVALTGNAKVNATVRGDIHNPIIEGSATTDNATVQTPQMSEPAAIQAAVEFNHNEFTIRQMQATLSDAVIKITGEGTLQGTGQFQFAATNVHPEHFVKDRPLSGTVSLEGKLNLASPSLEGVSGEAQVTQLDLTLRDIPVHQVRPIDVAIQNQKLTIRNFEVEGADTHIQVAGGADLQTRSLNIDLNGDTDLRILEGLIPNSAAQGHIETKLAVRGTADHPNLDGFLTVHDTQVQTVDPPLLLSNVDAELKFNGERVDIVRANGKLNEGEFKATGGAGLSAQGLNDASIHLTLSKSQLEYPEGLQSQLSSDIALSGSSPDLLVEGTVDIDSALYQKDIDLTQEIFTRITAEHNQPTFEGPSLTPSALAQQIRLDIEVRTPGLVTIANNMANMDLNGFFRVRGSIADPIILGRAAVQEGGELYFGPAVATESSVPGDRRDRYTIERGVIDFNNMLRTEPTFDFEASHELKAKDERYLVTLRASGTPERLRTEFTSDPVLDEQDIKFMLLTGRTYSELQGSMLAVGEEQFANYFSGRVSGFFETAGSALGLDTVRIEPVAVADEQDLGARLTLGKDVTKNFGLIYSQSLAGARSQTWIANYSTFKKLLLRAINDTENKEVRFELKQDLRIGGGPPLPKRIAPRNEFVLGDVAFLTKLDITQLQKKVTQPGKPFNAYRMNEDVRHLKKYLAKQSLLRARVRAERNAHDGRIDVKFTVEEGPKITFAYQGAKIPGKVQEDIRQIWLASLTEATALQASNKRVLRYMRDEGYLKATVAAAETSSTVDAREYAFKIEPGEKFKDPKWIFKGVEAVDVPDKAGTVMEKPEAIQQKIQFDFQKQGFLDATSTVPELIFQEEGPRFVVNIERGNQYMVKRIEFTGNAFMDNRRLTTAGRETAEELPQFPFTNTWIETAQQRATAEYWSEGFNDVEIAPATTTDKAHAQVTVHFTIQEGERQTIEAIQIDGVDITDMSHVKRYFQFKEGDPVDYTRISLTRKKLYDTSLFKRVDIEMVQGSSPNGYVAHVHLNEAAPWRFRYGIAVGRGTEASGRDLGVTSDFSYSNLFGKGITTGLSVKDTRSFRDARIYGMLPVFLNRDIKTTLTLFRTRDLRTIGSVDDLKGFTAQQQRRLKNYYILTYDYSHRWEHLFDRDPNDTNIIQNTTVRVARLNGTLTRDTRDDILNATRGNFFSNALEIAPPLLGSNILFVRNYTQYFRFRQVKKNLVWANAVRGGFARAFSSTALVPSEQFFAGGGTTLRAFKQDQLTLKPGNAMLIMNSELRFPLFWRFSAVTFFDAGNVYEHIGNANVLRLRYSPGFGLRIKTPFVPVRFDLGFNLWPRTGEDRRRFAFGVGQAF